MKKKHVFPIISAVVIVVIGIILFVPSKKRTGVNDYLTDLPNSKPHHHVSPDGDIISHTHVYDKPTRGKSKEMLTDKAKYGIAPVLATTPIKKKHRIQKAWEKLDLIAIKRDRQPYSIKEMNDMWWSELYGKENKWIEAIYPRDEWLQRYMDLGYPFLDISAYKTALHHRKELERKSEEFHNLEPVDPEDPDYTHKVRALRWIGIPTETHISWEEYEENFMKRKVVYLNAFEDARQDDPNFGGGFYTIDGGMIPLKENTSYVHIDPDTGMTKVVGKQLTSEEQYTLTMFGIVPEGMKVVYTDKSGIPLPSDMKPRFYERAMAQLDIAEQQVLQQIADHDALFNQAENGQEKKPIVVEKQHEHPHPHENMPPTHKTERPGTQQKMPPQFGKNFLPPVPTEPHDPVQVQKWFEELILLHGGDLPKDLKALQDVIIELGAIRKLGEETIPKPPPRPLERPTPPNTPSDQ